jgi:hypothetical protein
MSGPRTYGEVCAWPGCHKAISWKQAWCYKHWKLIPEEERYDRQAAVFAARTAGGSEESTVRTEPTGESTDEAAEGDR